MLSSGSHAAAEESVLRPTVAGARGYGVGAKSVWCRDGVLWLVDMLSCSTASFTVWQHVPFNERFPRCETLCLSARTSSKQGNRRLHSQVKAPIYVKSVVPRTLPKFLFAFPSCVGCPSETPTDGTSNL